MAKKNNNKPLDQKAILLREISEVFKRHQADPNMSVEVLGEMMMHVFVAMQTFTPDDITPHILAFFDTMKDKASEVLSQVLADRNKN
jgi:uncharacterized protein YejL (UPF0352 family)